MASRRAMTPRRSWHGLLVTIALAAPLIGGCSSYVPAPAPVGRATDVDPAEAAPEYWWDKPAQTKLPVADFDRAFAACEATLRSYLFQVDRTDARAGVITSMPMTASQWFEPWRKDNVTSGGVARASVGTFRRTVRFDIRRTPEGKYSVEPKVVVERQTVVGRRLGGVLGSQTFKPLDQGALTSDIDAGPPPTTYWYAIARDYELEAELADTIVKKMY